MTEKEIWSKIVEEANSILESERLSESYLKKFVIDFETLSEVIAYKISNDLGNKDSDEIFSINFIFSELKGVFEDEKIINGLVLDLHAVKQRDPAASGYLSTLLFSKGFLALQTHRASNYFFNSKEWNSLVSKNEKFENTPIKIQKKFYRTFTLKKIEKDELLLEKNELHQQMQLVFA